MLSVASTLFFFYLVWIQFTSAPIAAVAVPWQVSFQEGATDIADRISDLHGDVMTFVVAIVLFIGTILGITLHLFHSANRKALRVAFSHHTLLEKV